MTQAHFDELCELVAREMARLRVPGVALGIVNGAETFTAGFGVTNVEHPAAPWTPTPSFRSARPQKP